MVVVVVVVAVVVLVVLVVLVVVVVVVFVVLVFVVVVVVVGAMIQFCGFACSHLIGSQLLPQPHRSVHLARPSTWE